MAGSMQADLNTASLGDPFIDQVLKKTAKQLVPLQRDDQLSLINEIRKRWALRATKFAGLIHDADLQLINKLIGRLDQWYCQLSPELSEQSQ
jgi:hypothetical protein